MRGGDEFFGIGAGLAVFGYEAGVERVGLRVDSRYAQRDALLAGLGIADNLTLIAEPEVAAGRLQRVMPDWSRTPVPVHAVFPSHRFLTPKVRVFVERAQTHFPVAANG